MIRILQQYQKAIRFIVVFIGLYLLLNTIYGLWIEAYLPLADPITSIVTRHVIALLAIFHESLSMGSAKLGHIPVLMGEEVVINVFEGCNSLNVIIVYISFLVAFRRNIPSFVRFTIFGSLLIYIMNLARVALLFEVALKFPDYLYFFHKFLFTGIIYAVVFVIWYFWIKSSRADERRKSAVN